jgi:hypothetical protein
MRLLPVPSPVAPCTKTFQPVIQGYVLSVTGLSVTVTGLSVTNRRLALRAQSVVSGQDRKKGELKEF